MSPVGVVEVEYEMATSVPGQVVIESLNVLRGSTSLAMVGGDDQIRREDLGETQRSLRKERLGETDWSKKPHGG